MSSVRIGYDRNPSPRVAYGIELLTKALKAAGYTVESGEVDWSLETYRSVSGRKIYVGNRSVSSLLGQLEDNDVLLYHSVAPDKEGFYLAALPGDLVTVSGGDDSGVLYGCQELARRVSAAGELPIDIAYGDAPYFKVRGPAIGLQKTTIEPPRQTYEYPVTPGRFPWFYDREHWLQMLDMMLEERCNIIYIWAGHPFSSFVKLDEYPEALEVTEEEFKLNVDTFRWLADEANKRGIWVVMKFYNIHIPLPFAEKHGLKLHQPKPLPLTSDYTRKSIAAFVKSFPNVGLMVCLGEALQGHAYGVEWFNETIIPGVYDGLRESGQTELPPIILRGHAIEPQKVIEAALPLYPNLYTESKYNGESLTTWTPRGRWQKDIHNHLGSLPSVHIINVHILANLEPFRFGAPSFIQKCMQAAKYRLKATGLHLYPLFFWDWPYAPDKAEPRLKQLDRDWIWFGTWFRYAWNPDRDPQAEREYWIGVLAARYGSREAGEAILDAYEASGECAPKILRRVGITEGNRQTMSLSMLMSQLTNAERHMPWPDLWESQAPQGERLDDFVKRELAGLPHIGETPLDVVKDVERHADDALAAIQKAQAHVSSNQVEFNRLVTDMEAIHQMTYVFSHKIRAAVEVLTYKYKLDGDYFANVEHLESAAVDLEKSFEWYKKLTDLTNDTYLYANSMQTPQRKVPIKDGGIHKHWLDCYPYYEKELESFKFHLQELKDKVVPDAIRLAAEPIQPYRQAPFKLLSANAETFTIEKSNSVFADADIMITGIAEELEGLTGIRFGQQEADAKGVVIEFELEQPAQVLVGYLNSKDQQWLQPPSLEENTHADDRGGYEPVLRKGLRLYAYPSVNVHVFRFEAGRHALDLGKGAYTILGVIAADQSTPSRNIEHKMDGVNTLDWLYE